MVIAMRDRSVIIEEFKYNASHVMDNVTERTLQRMKAKAKYNKRVANRKRGK